MLLQHFDRCVPEGKPVVACEDATGKIAGDSVSCRLRVLGLRPKTGDDDDAELVPEELDPSVGISTRIMSRHSTVMTMSIVTKLINSTNEHALTEDNHGEVNRFRQT